MTTTKILELAKLGIPLSTMGYAYQKVKKKNKNVKDLLQGGTAIIVGSEFTKITT